MPLKTPTRVNQCIHIDDYMSNKREVDAALKEIKRVAGELEKRVEGNEEQAGKLPALERRVGEIEQHHDKMENTMQDLKTSIHTVEKAIIGDIEHPETPGMAENVRQLVKMHAEERSEKQPMMDSVPWKAIVMALGIIGGLVWAILKLVDGGAGG